MQSEHIHLYLPLRLLSLTLVRLSSSNTASLSLVKFISDENEGVSWTPIFHAHISSWVFAAMVE